MQDFFTFKIPSQKIIYFFINATLLALTVTTVTKSGFLCVKNLSILIQKCQYIDTKTSENKSQLIYFKFLLKTAVFLVFLAYELYVCSISHNMSYFKIFILTPSIDMYYEFLVVVVITSVVAKIKNGYVYLNANLEIACKSPQLIDKMRFLTQDYRILGETIEVFNDLFGYQLILITLHCGLLIISGLNFIIIALKTEHDDLIFFHVVASNMLVIIFVLVRGIRQ